MNLHLYPRASSRACRTRISTHLRSPEPICCDSGSGYRLIWAIDLANTEENAATVPQGSHRIRPRSSISPKLPSIDDLARITKFYGSPVPQARRNRNTTLAR